MKTNQSEKWKQGYPCNKPKNTAAKYSENKKKMVTNKKCKTDSDKRNVNNKRQSKIWLRRQGIQLCKKGSYPETEPEDKLERVDVN